MSSMRYSFQKYLIESNNERKLDNSRTWDALQDKWPGLFEKKKKNHEKQKKSNMFKMKRDKREIMSTCKYVNIH